MSQRATLHVTVVTALQTVFDGEAEAVNAPGSEGRLGILPHHAPLLSLLDVGELRVREHGEEEIIFVAGGFLEVNHNVVTILADDAERAEEIDEAHADEARRRAEATLRREDLTADVEAAAAAELERAVGRLRVAELSHQRHGPRRRRPAPGELPTGNE